MEKLYYANKINNIQNTGEVILQNLIEMIYEGKLKPNQTLRQEIIAEWFKVTRVPVRDALQRLVGIGLAVKIPRRGVRVANISVDTLKKLYEVRVILESAAIKLVTRNVNDETLNKLKLLIDNQKVALNCKSTKEFIRIDDEFHNVLYSKDTLLNEVLSNSIYSIRLRIKHARDIARYNSELKGWASNSIRRHFEIYNAVASKNENYAKNIIIEIINESKKDTFNFVKNILNKEVL